jgi:hypothetical protein
MEKTTSDQNVSLLGNAMTEGINDIAYDFSYQLI